jgi:hypothetical protein
MVSSGAVNVHLGQGIPDRGEGVADRTGIGGHEFGVGVFEDHTAHPVAGLKPRGIRAGDHFGLHRDKSVWSAVS